LLNPRLRSLARLEFTAQEQRQEAIRRIGKMSIQGIQPKLSATLSATRGRFEIVDQNGRFILKPPSLDFPELPENEDVTMRMAIAVGIEAPLLGLLVAIDGSFTYFIRRFDRQGRKRLPLEDFAQLTGESRDTKYDSSMEKVASVVEKFCTFPAVESVKLFERTLFSFLVGNEDMHLKNFSLITRDGRVELAPAYDFLNSTIAISNPREEFALPLNGKKSNLTRNDLLGYFGVERLKLNDRLIYHVISRIRNSLPTIGELLDQCFLSQAMKDKFRAILQERARRLGF